MKLYIKNMVCNRCVMVVKQELEKAGLQPENVILGEATIAGEISEGQKKVLVQRLNELGFEWMDDKKSRTIEKIKNLIIDLVHHLNGELSVNLSGYLSERLQQDYSYLSNLFSEVEGTTIEKYFIAQKIERVKELLVYDELTLSEIAYLLNYSSVAYLSNQFKKVSGLTPSHFKKIKEAKRIPIDLV